MTCVCTHDASTHYNGLSCAARFCSCEKFRFYEPPKALRDASDEQLAMGLMRCKIKEQEKKIEELTGVLEDCLSFITNAEMILGPERMGEIRVDPYGTIHDAKLALGLIKD